jgi:hypothetical protein
MRGLRQAPVAAMLLFALAASGPGDAAAAPVIDVRARTAIEIDPIRRDFDGITVRGRVVDKFSRAPVPWVSVELRLDQFARSTSADSSGGFTATFAVTAGKHDLSVEFRGDLHHESSRFEILGFDVSKNPLSLGLTLSRGVASYGEDDVTARVTASSDFGGVVLPIAVLVGPEGADERDLTQVGVVRTDEAGNGELAIPVARLGEPGRKRVLARYDGDVAYDEARATATFLVKTDTRIEFRASSTDLAYEDRFRGNGSVLDAQGGAVDGGAVTLMVGSRSVAETGAKPDGSFSFDISASELGSGKFNVQAVFDPSREWQRGSRSDPLTVLVASPEPVPVSYTVAAFALTALAILAFIAMRTRPWEKWLARWRKRRQDEEESDEDQAGQPDEVHTGLTVARPSMMSTLRRTKDHGFAGQVRDAVSGRVVGGARMMLSHGTIEHLVDVRGDGRFVAEELTPGGIWAVAVEAYGYITERFEITIPHRGELRGVRIDVLPVRERIFAMYGMAARPMLPDPALWGIWTPRQIFDHVREGRPPASAMAALTDFVEETYFSQRTATEDLIPVAEQQIRSARTERDTPQA